MATTLPNEILIEICRYLSPSDLYNLTLVCKRFRNLLWNKTNESTQLIWRISRLNFIPHLKLPCPEGMSEQKYVWLMQLLDKCMFCEERNKWKLSMYWEFKMYCCQRCLAQRTVSRDTLIKEWEISEKLLTCIVPLPPNAQRPQLFLMKQVTQTIKEYKKLSITKKENWIKRKQKEINNLKDENKKYIKQHDYGRYDYNERLERLFSTLQMSTDYAYRRREDNDGFVGRKEKKRSN
ncbi:4559_t:CDS:2 [Funneliformis geosporum]|uniref:1997_t:CDS:1 n=1 Tax=Funneliformis geosporum TaxID=1117311 RepID=A0A9W4X0F5_9GLOM|nr:4559_t:CDS:2 [Funneliformis geosporum]CAI2177209.1 1997_t:CDS:2 [Funneliformis geosporum]